MNLASHKGIKLSQFIINILNILTLQNSLSVALEVSLSIFVPLVFVPWSTLFGPTLRKNCWFAMLLPTHQNQPYPKTFSTSCAYPLFMICSRKLYIQVRFYVLVHSSIFMDLLMMNRQFFFLSIKPVGELSINCLSNLKSVNETE